MTDQEKHEIRQLIKEEMDARQKEMDVKSPDGQLKEKSKVKEAPARSVEVETVSPAY